MKHLMIVLVVAACILGQGCTSVSEDRIGNSEKLHWEAGVKNPDMVEHYRQGVGPNYEYREVVHIHGAVAPIYGQSGFLRIVKKRAAQWGCNAVLEDSRGAVVQTTQYTYIGRRTAYSFPVTTATPYGSFIGIRKYGWRPSTKEEMELRKKLAANLKAQR